MTTLIPGQYKIGNTVFGEGTMIHVSSCEPGGHGTSPGDYPVGQSDELRFSRDYMQPGSYTFEMAALNNKPMLNMVGPGEEIPDVDGASTYLETIANEWRADEVRLIYGSLKPLLYHRDGMTRMIYGRPRKFVHANRSRKAEWVNIVADFQCADTFTYEEAQGLVTALPTSAGTTSVDVVRAGGSAPAWFTAFITGPINDPKIKVGNLFTVELDYNLAAGKIIQISSYPWERRVIDSDGFNLSPLMVGNSPYLDQMKLPANATTGIGLSGSSTTGATKLELLWREAYHSF